VHGSVDRLLWIWGFADNFYCEIFVGNHLILLKYLTLF
jgi:hypothetical protein